MFVCLGIRMTHCMTRNDMTASLLTVCLLCAQRAQTTTRRHSTRLKKSKNLKIEFPVISKENTTSSSSSAVCCCLLACAARLLLPACNLPAPSCCFEFWAPKLACYYTCLYIPSSPFHSLQMSNSAKKGPSEKKIIVYAYAKLANISPDIRCAICSSFLTRTHSVPECLHRICGECVEDKETSLMQYKSECPSCRYHIPIKQFLRRDETFDKMVSLSSQIGRFHLQSAFYFHFVEVHHAVSIVIRPLLHWNISRLFVVRIVSFLMPLWII